MSSGSSGREDSQVRVLERLGLGGAFQVHVAPTILRADHRAHQVFLGFQNLDELKARLSKQYSNDTKAWIIDEAEPFPCTISELPNPQTSEQTVIIPAISDENPGNLYGLVWIVDRLLGPGGCPWDQEQTHESLKRHLIEECYELIQAIDDADEERMNEELGDVLLQPIMHAQMKGLAGGWDIDGVVRTITEKLVRRHPHVFGTKDPLPPPSARGESEPITSDEVLQNWDRIKRQEKGSDSVLDGVPKAMPALLRAYEVSKRAARSGFEWPEREAVWDKLHEEELELRAAIERQDPDRIEAEVGDLLFTAVNIARWAGVEPEDALRRMLDRFTRRFRAMEQSSPRPLRELDASEWDKLWEGAKATADQETLS